MPFYDAWNGLPSDTLLVRAYDFLAVKDKADSALVCYTIVANRYYEGRNSLKDVKNAAEAMVNLGGMYMEYFPDYKRSYEYLLEAKRLAEENDLTYFKAYAYLSLCNIMDINGLLRRKPDPELVPMLQKAFYASVESENYELTATVISNLVQKSIEYGKPELARKEVSRFSTLRPEKRPGLWAHALLMCKGLEAYAAWRYAGAASLFLEAARRVDVALLGYRDEILATVLAADMYRKAGDDVEAERTYLAALSTAEANSCMDYGMIISSRLADLYGAAGRADDELRYGYRYLSLKDSLMYTNQASDIDKVRFLDTLDEVNAEVQAYSVRQARLLRVLGAALAAVAVFGAMLYFLYRSYRKLKKAHDHIYMQNVELLKREEEAASAAKPKYAASNMDTDDKHALFGRIVDVLSTSDEVYSQGFTLNRLAELVNSRYRYVSQVINEETDGNFNALLNRYRIKEACRRMNDVGRYGHYKVEAIAESVGFKSRTGFSALFKKMTGLSPAEYHNIARSKSDKSAY